MNYDDWNEKLIKSAEIGNLKQIKKWLALGADINAEIGNNTALASTSIKGHFETVKFLVENGADVKM